MAMNFSRRSFLKTSAAAAVLGGLSVVLTGCDSDSSSTPAFKRYDDNKDYLLGKLKIELQYTGSIDSQPQVCYTLTNKGSEPITLYRDSFSAAYNGKALHLTKLDADDDSNVASVTITAGDEVDVVADFVGPEQQTAATLDKVVFKFHYNDQSIQFKSEPTTSNDLTTGVYTDKFSL